MRVGESDKEDRKVGGSKEWIREPYWGEAQ